MGSDRKLEGACPPPLGGTEGDLFDVMRRRLKLDGWLHVPDFQRDDDRGERMLRFARSLGALYPVTDGDSDRPVVDSCASADAPYDAPFDRLEGIGWHNDFSTCRARPRWSLSYVRRAAEGGGGDWRVVQSARVLAGLGAEGPTVLNTLRGRLPYSFSDEGALTWHRGLNGGRLRFYGRALRDGARRVYGMVPPSTDYAIRAVEAAADREGVGLRAESGALLVVDNWRTMHDRTAQSAGGRRVVLAFVVP